MSYTQLAQAERYQIFALLSIDCTIGDIAAQLGRSKATISRELRRNSTGDSYDPDAAQALARRRQQDKPRRRVTRPAIVWVRQLLKKDWSPEQISLWLKQFKAIRVSHEWIYQYVGADKQSGGELWKRLRCQKQRRKRYGSHDRRGQIKNRTFIDERPPVVELRARLGDWEIDTIAGARHSGALLSLTERRSLHILLAKLAECTADEVVYATLALLEPLSGLTHTITSDNGKEFSGHEDIARVLEAAFYFAHPYSPWERGTNENANGLIRQYFPKSRDFSTITQEELDNAMDRLNNRPRKCLGMLTPNQVLYGITPDVALAS